MCVFENSCSYVSISFLNQRVEWYHLNMHTEYYQHMQVLPGLQQSLTILPLGGKRARSTSWEAPCLTFIKVHPDTWWWCGCLCVPRNLQCPSVQSLTFVFLQRRCVKNQEKVTPTEWGLFSGSGMGERRLRHGNLSWLPGRWGSVISVGSCAWHGRREPGAQEASNGRVWWGKMF